MNRRQKIIVSVTGIFLVLLILVGLTYAFFLTRIRGNNNPTSISVTTANLELVYQDADNGDIIGQGMILEPNSETPIGEKTFTVTNSGNDTVNDYAVIVENLAVKYVVTTDEVTAGQVTNLVNGEDYDEDGVSQPDMKLVIECTSYINYGKEGQEVSGTCEGMDGYLPEKSGILLTNDIDEGITHEYKATLTYLEDGTDQSADMNKTITGKFNIIDTKTTVDIEGSIANYTLGDKVTINSEYKESVIYPDGSYKFMGVKPDNHTIRLVGSTTTEIGKLSVKKGTSENVEKVTVDGVTIPQLTITDTTRTMKVNINKENKFEVVLPEAMQGTIREEIRLAAMDYFDDVMNQTEGTFMSYFADYDEYYYQAMSEKGVINTIDILKEHNYLDSNFSYKFDYSSLTTTCGENNQYNCDFDGDGIISVVDNRILGTHYNSYVGDAKYDTKFDLDGNGEIKFADMQILLGNQNSDNIVSMKLTCKTDKDTCDTIREDYDFTNENITNNFEKVVEISDAYPIVMIIK